MMGNLYTALKAAGVDEEKARSAAEESAQHESRIADLRSEMTGVRGELTLVKWMVGFNLAMTVAIVGKLFLQAH
jgi:hypothetical protein